MENEKEFYSKLNIEQLCELARFSVSAIFTMISQGFKENESGIILQQKKQYQLIKNEMYLRNRTDLFLIVVKDTKKTLNSDFFKNKLNDFLDSLD